MMDLESLLRRAKELPKLSRKVLLLGSAAHAYMKKQYSVLYPEHYEKCFGGFKFMGLDVHVNVYLPPYFCDLVEPDDPLVRLGLSDLKFEDLVRAEVYQAVAKHKPINSIHEGYAVILEELDEFWEQVRKKKECRSKEEMLKELVQIAAMCWRTAEDCDLV